MIEYMNTSFNYGKSNYLVFVSKNGGNVMVYKDLLPLFKGQWIPGHERLTLKSCPFAELENKIKNEIINNIDQTAIKWPCVSEKNR